ncbi:hypothetical protein ACFY7H_10625 [Streptomyces sp. NPDC012794]|uniref:hypothetical protein n=1 Tax=Streptomyces sp. NPDC012794 TaxID=3364850 RepID=UPI0036AEF23C
MHDQLQIRMKGELDADRLSSFRREVGLTPRGRLDDDWDEEFGRRELRTAEQGRVKVSLWRYAHDDWMVSLDYARDPLPAEETEALRQVILDAAARAGLTVTAQVSS